MPTGLGKIFKSTRHPDGQALSTMRILRAILGKASFSRRSELMLRILRRGPFDLAAMVYYREQGPGVVEVTVMSSFGVEERVEQLQEALSSSTSPLLGMTPDAPRRLSASEDPFAPGVAFLRRRDLSWLLALPLSEPVDAGIGRPCLLLGSVRGFDIDDPRIESLVTAWGIYRQVEHLSRLHDRFRKRDPDGLSADEIWLQSPAPLALMRGREIQAVNESARNLLKHCFGTDEGVAREWLKAAVLRLDSSGRTSDQLVASRRQRYRIEVTLGRVTQQGQLVALRDVTSEVCAEDRRAATVSTLSHELRTPLASMKNSVGLVLSGETGELAPDQERFLIMTMRNIDRLDRLIGDLLDVSRARAGRLALRRELTDLGPLLREAMAMQGTTARQRDISLDCDGLPESFPAHVDGDKIVQMVHNTVGNALKYTEDGGKVRVWLDSRISSGTSIDRLLADYFFLPLKTFALVVEDNGTGMSSELLRNICSPFRRGDEAENSDAPGTGLGLHITRALVEAHGGRLVIESELKIGTTVRIILPRDPDSERVLVAAKRLAEYRKAAAGDVELLCFDARRPDREFDEKEWRRASRFLTECVARFETESGGSGEDDSPPLVALANGLWTVAVIGGQRLQAAWKVARGRQGCPEQLRDLEWQMIPWPDAPSRGDDVAGTDRELATVGAPKDDHQRKPQTEDR